MAEEILINCNIKVDQLKIPEIGVKNIKYDQTALGGPYPGYITVGFAAEEDVSLAELSTPGFCFMRNLDSSNFVTYGPKSAGSMVAFGELKAGEPTLLRLTRTSPTLRMQADTGDVKLQILVIED